jgi:alpha-L-fucosidase
LKIYGETIYATQGGPLTERNWGVTTQKGNKVYLHVLNWQDETLTIPRLSKKVLSAKMFRDKTELKFSENDFGVTIRMPKSQQDEIDTVVELEMKN